MTIATLLHPIPVGDFLDQYFFKRPFARKGGAEPYVALGDWPMIERLLTATNLDILVASNRLGSYAGSNPGNLNEAQALLAAGYTIGFRHVQRFDDAYARVAADFASDFCATTDIHLYCTPAGEKGFGWHYDAEEVFVLQTQGSKNWSLRKNTVNPWPLIETLPDNMAYEREIMPLIRCQIQAGDWLYVPGGYWHQTEAGEASISLSIGLTCSSGIDVYDLLRDQLLRDLRWRERLPVAGLASSLTQEELINQYRLRFTELAIDLGKHFSSDQNVQHFLTQQPRNDVGHSA